MRSFLSIMVILLFVLSIQAQGPYTIETKGKTHIFSLKKNKKELSDPFNENRRAYPLLTTGFSFGVGKRISPNYELINLDWKLYADRLTRSWDCNLYVAYNINEYNALGLSFTSSASYARLDNAYTFDPVLQDQIYLGYVEDKIKLMILGPGYYFERRLSFVDVRLKLSVQAGLLGYKRYSWAVIERDETSALTWGMNNSLGVEVPLTKKISYGLKAGMIYGKLSKSAIGQNSITINDPGNLSRFDLNFTLCVKI